MERVIVSVPAHSHMINPTNSRYLLVPEEEYIASVTKGLKLKEECKVLTAENTKLKEQISQIKSFINE